MQGRRAALVIGQRQLDLRALTNGAKTALKEDCDAKVAKSSEDASNRMKGHGCVGDHLAASTRG